MVDGRTVYSPIFSGVFWEAVDVVLDDIERIEVISGPGATLWGINAMNGVINIITRDARATNGTLAEAGAGNRERGAAVRVGGSAGEGSGWRVYGKAFERDHGTLRSGRPIRDSSDRGQIGFRYDSSVKKRWLTVQGDAYRARIDQVPAARELSGANLLARWSEEVSEDSDLTGADLLRPYRAFPPGDVSTGPRHVRREPAVRNQAGCGPSTAARCRLSPCAGQDRGTGARARFHPSRQDACLGPRLRAGRYCAGGEICS
jgi:outer membrane receptor protein involved in Fe transport